MLKITNPIRLDREFRGAVIALSAGSLRRECTVSVFRAADGFRLPAEIYVPSKGTVQAAITGLTPAGARVDLTWSSSNTTCFRVDGSGLITAKGVGTTKICAVANNGMEADITITVSKNVDKALIVVTDGLKFQVKGKKNAVFLGHTLDADEYSILC